MQDLSNGMDFYPEGRLGPTLWSDPILAQIASLCANVFADVCAVYLLGQESKPVVFMANDPERSRAFAEAPYDGTYLERASSCGLSTVWAEPLVVNDGTIGTLILGSYSGDHRFEPRVATLLSSLAATAIDQKRQLLHHYRIANRLQRALLPSRLARVEGLDLDAAYRPADQETEVGGDWYDAFDIGNGSIGVCVGDVAGHGLDAAVSMSEIRRAIRAVAPTTPSPAAWLNYVDGIITAQGMGLSTAIAGIYDPRDHVLRYASAGHPHPVLVSAEGQAVFLPAGGLLLGLGMSPASQDWTITLTPDTTCVLYTDGLLEYGHDVVEGERTLLSAVEMLARNGIASSAALHEYLFDRISNLDDVATLTLHRRGSFTDTRFKLTYTAIPQSATLCREALRYTLSNAGFSADALFDVLTAIGEAVANAIEHGSHEPGETFDVEVAIGDRELRANVCSRGHWKAFTQCEERGRGLPIMRALSHSVKVASIKDQTTIELAFVRP